MKLINRQTYKLSEIPNGKCFISPGGWLHMVLNIALKDGVMNKNEKRISCVMLYGDGYVVNFGEDTIVKYQSVQIRKIKPRVAKEKQTDTVRIIAK